jgi:hypothetical protein
VLLAAFEIPLHASGKRPLLHNPTGQPFAFLAAMATSKSNRSSQLSESWVVDDASYSDASYEESSELEPEPSRAQVQRSPKIMRSGHLRSSKAISSPSKPRRSSRAAPAVLEPELVMPSIHEGSVSGSWMDGEKDARENGNVMKRRPKAREEASQGGGRGDGRVKNEKEKTESVERRPTQSELLDQMLEGFARLGIWLLDFLRLTLKFVRVPLAVVLAIYVCAGLVVLVQNMLMSSIYSALSPVCRIPGISVLHLPMCHLDATPTIKTNGGVVPVEFDELMTVQSHFEEVLEESAKGVSLPMDMKRGETSIRDLRQVVRFSRLSSRNELVLEFDGFIETARIASYDLQKFNSHVGRAVDNVLATARWTQRVLDDMAFKQSSRGMVPSFITDKLLAPFQPMQFTESKLLDQYIRHSGIVSEEIEKLIEEAQALLLILQNLDDRLDVIHGIAFRDDAEIQGSKDEILSQLWTKLGGNRAALGKFNKQLQLLQHVGEYRKVALAHVSGTILRLQAMGAELEELRERVGSAEVLRDRTDIPLSVHLESIRLGVERLEQGRQAAREIEKRHLQRVLERGKDTEMRMIADN